MLKQPIRPASCRVNDGASDSCQIQKVVKFFTQDAAHRSHWAEGESPTGFLEALEQGTPPRIFHAYAELYRTGLNLAVRDMFRDTLQIAISNVGLNKYRSSGLGQGPGRESYTER